ncbi:hypothetical protein Aph02nite_06400 [Actinoplanes philippinensis]|uniref:Lipoprotein n=1 Tax=Actinoplanes philippinensis TaxID=35752 RepID=A0A1I2CTF2_9ACTN|nr:hypothetical protein [Actinoplanes philippinensis]GIE74690.1 hypothetical protein Aph02nite_06400 [Actinoplanes philippinensis]SFE71616.1 hypothetical protein SAMN05421541_103193 [Actinoplanes philippinensis]
MKLSRMGTLMLVAGGALTVTAACSAQDPQPTQPDAPRAAQQAAAQQGPAVQRVVLSEGSDRTASRSAGNWATYADHVLVVTVVGETRHPVLKKEAERGEGLIARTVSLRVDNVLWSAPDAPQPAPTEVKLAAAGWLFNNHSGPVETKIAIRDSARLEVGHTYIKALEWIDDPCSGDPEKGSWEGLGSGDTIPYDTGVPGAGEFEGQVRTADQSKARTRLDTDEARTLRGQVISGTPVSALVSGLRVARPAAEGYLPQECDPADN